MIEEHTWMARLICMVMVVCAAGVACTTPNPRSCGDGTCTDPAFPFCDVDGALDGTPDSCIAVECTPGEVTACRGKEAIVCNRTGNDFDLLQCPLGCDVAAGGCLTCSSNAQCDNPTPICDAGPGTCRGCTTDDECDSKVCDRSDGTCLTEASIVYASPTASNNSPPCSLAQPCSLVSAVANATSSGVPLTLRMLPGTYTNGLVVATPTGVPQQVVASGAIIASAGIVVRAGANVDIRDVEVTSATANGRVLCIGTAAVRTSLTVRRSRIAVTNSADMLDAVQCVLRLETTELAIDGSSVSSAIGLSDGVTLDGDQLYVHPTTGTQKTFISTIFKNINARITNSLIVSAGISANTSDSALPGSQLLFAYNTFVFPDFEQISCESPRAFRTARFENNILFSGTTTDPVLGTNCTFVNNVMSPGAPSGGNIVADPKFVDVAASNFHLQATSPAVNAGVPSTVGLDPDHDFDGVARPQGPKPDIGAFELKP